MNGRSRRNVVMALDLKSTETIADVGAGTGYFARRFAHHAGKVYAVDIDQKLLDIAGKDAPPNLKTVLASPVIHGFRNDPSTPFSFAMYFTTSRTGPPTTQSSQRC